MRQMMINNIEISQFVFLICFMIVKVNCKKVQELNIKIIIFIKIII